MPSVKSTHLKLYQQECYKIFDEYIEIDIFQEMYKRGQDILKHLNLYIKKKNIDFNTCLKQYDLTSNIK